jgi:hypothetical protein
MKILKLNQAMKAYQRDDIYIVPVVAVVEGVLNGELAPIGIFHANEWDGIPVVDGHPVNAKGEYIQVNESSKEKLGYLQGTQIKEGKMIANMELGVAVLENYPEIQTKIEAGTLEVSTGYLARTIEQEGEFNGKAYSAIQVEIIPDHLALLTNDRGACSLDDGCGAPKANKHGEPMKQKANKWPKDATTTGQMHSEPGSDKRLLTVNKMSFDDIRYAVYQALKEIHSEDDFYNIWIMELFDDYFIYEDKEGDFYHQGYGLSGDKVALIGEKTKVDRVVTYEPKTNHQSHITKGQHMDKEKLVGQVIKCNKNSFTESDTQTLLALDEGLLQKMVANEQGDPEPQPAAPTASDPVQPVTAEVVETIVANSLKPITDRLDEQGGSIDEAKIAEIVANTLNQQNTDREKDDLVKVIANSGLSTMKEAHLQKLDISDLKEIAADFNLNANVGSFYGMGNAPVIANSKDEPEEPVGVFVKKEVSTEGGE